MSQSFLNSGTLIVNKLSFSVKTDIYEVCGSGAALILEAGRITTEIKAGYGFAMKLQFWRFRGSNRGPWMITMEAWRLEMEP
jgi:hypothetical protein